MTARHIPHFDQAISASGGDDIVVFRVPMEGWKNSLMGRDLEVCSARSHIKELSCGCRRSIHQIRRREEEKKRRRGEEKKRRREEEKKRRRGEEEKRRREGETNDERSTVVTHCDLCGIERVELNVSDL